MPIWKTPWWKRCYHKVSTLKAEKMKLLKERIDDFVKVKGADYLCRKGLLNDLMSREFYEHWVEFIEPLLNFLTSRIALACQVIQSAT